MHLRHAHNLAQARTQVAWLADDASDDDASSAYEHVLIELDRLHGDQSPDVYRDTVAQHRAAKFDLASAAIEGLEEHGVDPLSVELVLAMLHDAYAQDCG